MEYCYKCNNLRRCCPRCHCCQCCCCCCPCPVTASFTAVKRDGVTGAPLSGAAYTLYLNGQAVGATVSDASGALAFSGLAQGQYELAETSAPIGYRLDTVRRAVVVDACGNVTIDGQEARGHVFYNVPLANLSFRKTDSDTGLPLAGAVFTLSNGQTATSGADGQVKLGTLTPGAYTMRETAAPAGYAANSTEYQVQVPQNGGITINGTPVEGFSVANTPLPAFSFRKYGADTSLPLANAVFTLSNGATATSDSGGLVQFGVLAPGAYTMRETTAPAGYQPVTTVYNVVVAGDGSITVDGAPAAGFSVRNTRAVSPTPTINAVTEGDTVLTGRGVAGASIAVELPGGTQLAATVDQGGQWTVTVPAGTTLQAGQTVYVTQTVSGDQTSERASFIVQSRPA